MLHDKVDDQCSDGCPLLVLRKAAGKTPPTAHDPHKLARLVHPELHCPCYVPSYLQYWGGP